VNFRAPRFCARAAAGIALALATVAARAVPRAESAPHAHPLSATAVLARYAHALATVKRAPVVAFDYAVEQLGLRNMEQTHRVYRSGRSERDETLIVDGYELQAPSIRIINNRTYRYDIAAVAPRPGAYRFVYTGAIAHGSNFIYVFRTAPFASPAFAVTEVEIDGVRFLPSAVRFKLAGNNARGSGTLAYESHGGYWVVRDAVVDARLTSGATAHEHIAWSDYSFPLSLPDSTFEAPHPFIPDAAGEAGPTLR
jgi:hypothetical protein